MKKKAIRGQMSESTAVIGLLCISGGFQDAYTFDCRGGVFANAQTGNMVLMGQNFAMGHWQTGLRYLIPVLAFAAGVYFAERVKRRYKSQEGIHWRQIILLLEAVLLLGVGVMPQGMNIAANVLVSFVCAMQVQSFRKLNGNAYATTMCIGNMRTATELMCSYHCTKEKALRDKSLLYFGFIGIFILGAALGGAASHFLEEKAIWVSSLLLAAAFAMMFIKEDIEAHGFKE